MADFDIKDGAIRIESQDKEALRNHLVNKLKIQNKLTTSGKLSKGKDFPDIYIGGEKNYFRNRKGFDGFQFATEGAIKTQTNKRSTKRQHSTAEALKITKHKDKINRQIMDEASLFGMPIIKEHDVSIDSYDKYNLSGAPDDPSNTFLNPEINAKFKTKVEVVNRQHNYPYVIQTNEITGNPQVIPKEVYNEHGWPSEQGFEIKNEKDLKNFKEIAAEENPKPKRGKSNRKNGNGNGRNGKNGKLKINGKGKALIGSALAGGVSLLPTESGALQIRDEISQGKVGDATKTYAKDLFIGESQSRAFNQALKIAHSKLGKIFGKKLTRQALKIAGRQVVKKAGALATGPAAPIVMTSLLIKDAYDVANALSGGGLESQKVDTSNRKRLRHGRK